MNMRAVDPYQADWDSWRRRLERSVVGETAVEQQLWELAAVEVEEGEGVFEGDLSDLRAEKLWKN